MKNKYSNLINSIQNQLFHVHRLQSRIKTYSRSIGSAFINHFLKSFKELITRLGITFNINIMQRIETSTLQLS